MRPLSILIIVVFATAAFDTTAAQDEEKFYQKIFKPIKEFRTRKCDPNFGKPGCKCAKLKDKRKGKLCERCVEKAKEVAEKEIEKKKLCLELEQLALDKKKLEEEKKDFEKQLEEKYKPWDVADGPPEVAEGESPDELLKMAANVKKDQELAPKKIQALQYISSVGCSKVDKAPEIILKGLKDGNVNVRAAAVQAILSPYLAPYGTYGDYFPGTEMPDAAAYGGMVDSMYTGMGTCNSGSCAPRSTRTRKFRSMCGSCRGKGCDFCKHQGHVEKIIAQICQDCPEEKPNCAPAPNCQSCQGRGVRARRSSGCSSNGCASCNIQGQAMDVAFEPCDCQGQPVVGMGLDQCTGQDACQACCSEEIQKELKRMATEVKNGCYYEPNATVRSLAAQALELCPQKKQRDTERPAGSDDRRSTESFGVDDEAEIENETTYNFNFENSSRRRVAHENVQTHTSAQAIDIPSNDKVEFQLNGDYLIPNYTLVEIETSEGRRLECIVVDSAVGKVTLKGTSQPIRISIGETVRFGVLASGQQQVYLP